MYEQIILISLDTLRSDCVGANPYKLWPSKYAVRPELHTEILDDLIRSSAFFPNCIASAPYTSAAHASLFTGKWPLNHGCYELFNHKVNSRSIFTEAQRLGYRTIFKTDFPITLGSNLGFERGVEHYIIEDDDAFLTLIADNRPTVALAHFGGLHIPYGFHNLKYGGAKYIQTVQMLERELSDPSSGVVDRLVETYRNPEDLDLMVRYKRIVQHLYSNQDYDRLFGLYLEGINFFLANRFSLFLSRLRDALKGKRSLLVLFGDHGEEYDRESYGHHNSLAEGVIRVPVIFHGDGIKPALHAERIRSIDVTPTILDVVDGKPARPMKYDGVSLAATIWGDEPLTERTSFAQAYTSEQAEYVRFQERLLKSGRKTGSLPHVLYKEAIYEGPYKLVRQYHRYSENGGIGGLKSCEPFTQLEVINDDLVPVKLVDPTISRRLEAQLGQYNLLAKPRSQRAQMTPEIRQGLRNIGYRV